jgi:hypothetical protein
MRTINAFMRGVEIGVVLGTRDTSPPEICTMEGCSEPVKAKGICAMHYARKLRHGYDKHPERKRPPKACTFARLQEHFVRERTLQSALHTRAKPAKGARDWPCGSGCDARQAERQVRDLWWQSSFRERIIGQDHGLQRRSRPQDEEGARTSVQPLQQGHRALPGRSRHPSPRRRLPRSTRNTVAPQSPVRLATA